MIKAVAKDLVVLGLSRLNCEKLLEGKPIFITPESMDGKLKQAILLVAGETEQAILADLKQHPDVFDFSQAKVVAMPPGEEDKVQIGTRVYDAASGRPMEPAPALPANPEQRSRALVQRLSEIARMVEDETPNGLRCAIFLYDGDGSSGEVAHVSRDRQLTAVAVRRWLGAIEMPPPMGNA